MELGITGENRENRKSVKIGRNRKNRKVSEKLELASGIFQFADRLQKTYDVFPEVMSLL